MFCGEILMPQGLGGKQSFELHVRNVQLGARFWQTFAAFADVIGWLFVLLLCALRDEPYNPVPLPCLQLYNCVSFLFWANPCPHLETHASKKRSIILILTIMLSMWMLVSQQNSISKTTSLKPFHSKRGWKAQFGEKMTEPMSCTVLQYL